MIIVLLGAPGAGKGTQSRVLGARYGLKHLATGDIFRGEMAAKTTLGEKAAAYVKAGRLVPDEMVTEMIAAKIEDNGKYLLDGYPRTLAQAQALDGILKNSKNSIDLVVYLNLSRDAAIRRMTSRRLCVSCSEVYNVLTKPPKAAGVCDRCASKLEQREDDSEATAAKRLMVFEDVTQPLIAYYKSGQIFYEVDGSLDPDRVTAGLTAIIDKELAQAGKT